MSFRHPRAFALLFGGILVAVQAAFWLAPRADFSAREKRELADPPHLSASGVADGSVFKHAEDYLADHFPARETLVGVSAYLQQAEGLNAAGDTLRGQDGWLFNAALPEKSKTLRKNAEAIGAFAEAQTVPVTLLAAPTSGAIVSDELPALHDVYPDEMLLAEMERLLDGRVRYVDLYDAFSTADDPETLYYSTDHHWTTIGAYQAYCLLMQANGKTPTPADAFQIESVPGFYGTIYAKSGLWNTPPDQIELWTDPSLRAYTTVWDDNKPTPIEQQGMLFHEYRSQDDKYPVFLGGNHARVSIQTDAPGGKRLLVVKDSYAHALAPFLAEQYSQIDLLDLRYFKRQTVSDYLKEHPADEILFVYGLQSLASDKEIYKNLA